MDVYFEIAGNQIDGARNYQEDAFMVTHMGEGADTNSVALVIMADGMGGHAAGNVASNMVTSTFNKTFSGKYPTDDIPAALHDSLLKSNDTIREAVKETPGLQGMGCTMVTAFLKGNSIWWISVGDSHLYLLRDRSLSKKNADHSYGGYLKRMREQGVDVAADPKLSPNMLMSAMIGDEIAEIDLTEEPIKVHPGDRILVCSDGMDTLGQGAIIQYSSWADSPRECVKALLDAVEAAHQPRQDNTTVICIDVKEHKTPPSAEKPAEKPAKKPAKADMETTQEMDSLKAGDREDITLTEVDEVPVEEEIQAEDEVEYEEEAEAEGGGKKGLMIGILAAAALAAAGGTYFMVSGGDKAPPVVAGAQQVEVVPVQETKPEPAPPPEVATIDKSSETVKQESGQAKPLDLGGDVAIKSGSVFRDKLKSGGNGPEMVMLVSGEFRMGGRASSLARDELPRHSVEIDAFAMSKREITFVEYDRFAKATKRRLPADNGWDRETHPVVNVSWDDAYNYVKWLTKQSGKRYRLATEAEWEYAARGGTTRDYWWGRKIGKENAHCFDCESGLHPRKPAKAGFFKPNPFGLFDTSGNAMEWVHDCYHPNYKGAPSDGSVWEGGDCTRRVVRGGSYSSASSALRNAKREKLPSNKGYDNVGIRIVRDP
ncbi:MAG: SUMF1/EgtB/PvdO family nonheme iron enzyme [Gammaproteobacteria bacterium]|nr:SUMF1/EgtB/PvdO family nonheme iron enzyme [Gammaproteobacteria bacterium]